ncbi:MAG TPA: hypothetical protein VLX92_14815 [Kofleriaceae bacterium]|nr:hypothetical protein [Kofleriaceae bacterium]
MRLLVLALAACSGSPVPAANPARPAPPPADAAIDAAIDAAPDAGVPAAVQAAPPWIFRFHTAQRTETWTLRYADGAAELVVEAASGTTRYLGTAVDGDSLAVRVATSAAKLALDCKHAHRAISAKCNDTKARPIDVLDCYHPDFKEPMPFAQAPGIEYVVDATCSGYRSIAP